MIPMHFAERPGGLSELVQDLIDEVPPISQTKDRFHTNEGKVIDHLHNDRVFSAPDQPMAVSLAEKRPG